MGVVNELRTSSTTKFIREIGKKEEERIKDKYDSLTFPISYFGCLDTVVKSARKVENKKGVNKDDIIVIKRFPISTNDCDFYVSWMNPYEEGYIKTPLIDYYKARMGVFSGIRKKTYISPFSAYEKIVNGISIQAFLGEIGAIKVDYDSNEFDKDILNIITTIQPGCINEYRIRQTLPAYYFLTKSDESVRDEFGKQTLKYFIEAMERRKRYYPNREIKISENISVYSFDTLIQIIEKERNSLENNFKGKYLKKMKLEESKELCEEFFNTLVDAIDVAIKKVTKP